MSEDNPFDEVESPYELDKPTHLLNLKRLSNLALGIGGAAASLTLGLQVVGPALASVLAHKSETAESNAIDSNQGLAGTRPKFAPAELPNSAPSAVDLTASQVQVEQPVGVALPHNPKAVSNSPSNNHGLATQAPIPSPAAPIVLPAFDAGTQYGSVSSATPSSGSVATGGAGSKVNLRGGNDARGDSRGEHDSDSGGRDD
jgi:hypothetical protein